MCCELATKYNLLLVTPYPVLENVKKTLAHQWQHSLARLLLTSKSLQSQHQLYQTLVSIRYISFFMRPLYPTT